VKDLYVVNGTQQTGSVPSVSTDTGDTLRKYGKRCILYKYNPNLNATLIWNSCHKSVNSTVTE